MDDYAQICNVLHAYPELVNTGRFDEVGQLFRHGHIQVKGNPATYTGADEVAQMYKDTTVVPETGPDSLLFTSNLTVAVDGDQARCRSYFIAYHQRDTGLEPIVAGRYADVLQRHDGEWLFSERVMTIDLIGDLGEHISAPIEEFLSER